MSFGSKGWIGCFHCEKFNSKFFSSQKWTEWPSWPIFATFSCRNRNSENTLNMSVGSKGMDWVRPFQKIQLQVLFVPKVDRRALMADFRTVFMPELQSKKR